MQVDFNVLKGDIAEVEAVLSREYSEIWSRMISSRYVYPGQRYYSYAVCVYKEAIQARVERCDRVDAGAILPMATRGRGRYPSLRLATLSNSQPSIFPLRRPSCSLRDSSTFSVLPFLITFPFYLPILILLLYPMIFPFIHCGEVSFAFYFILFFVTIFSFSSFDLSNRRLCFEFIGLTMAFL